MTSFNASLVRLEGFRPRLPAWRSRRFNASLVRLEGKCAMSTPPNSKAFQCQPGSIRRISKSQEKVSLPECPCFNASLVRLEATSGRTASADTGAGFQCQPGSIRRDRASCRCQRGRTAFQCQPGSIRSYKGAEQTLTLPLLFQCQPGSIRRAARLCRTNSSNTYRFQCQPGSIRRKSARADAPLPVRVSMPAWFD